MIMSDELACVAAPSRSVESGGTPITVTFTPTFCRPFLSAIAAVSAPGSVRIDDCRGLHLRQEALRVGAEGPEHARLAAVEEEGVLRSRVGRVGGDDPDDRLRALDRRVDRLVADRHEPEDDRLCAGTVDHLLAAADAFLLGLRPEALVQPDRVPVDAAELGVDHLHFRFDHVRRLREVEVRRSTLAVDEADRDRRQLRVRLALSAGVELVIQNLRGRQSVGRRGRCRGDSCDNGPDQRDQGESGEREPPPGGLGDAAWAQGSLLCLRRCALWKSPSVRPIAPGSQALQGRSAVRRTVRRP